MLFGQYLRSYTGWYWCYRAVCKPNKDRRILEMHRVCIDWDTSSLDTWIFCTITVTKHILMYHHFDVIVTTMASQITSLMVVYSTVYSDADQRKHQSSASLAFVRGIHRWPVNSPHKGPVTRKMFPFDDVIMWWKLWMDMNILRIILKTLVTIQDRSSWA